MRPALAFIIAALLLLPFHALSYVKTVLHLVHYEHNHEHQDAAEDHEHAADLKDGDGNQFGSASSSHRHSPDQPLHNHDSDMWGLYSNLGVSQSLSFALHPKFTFLPPPLFEVNPWVTHPFSGSLLRPPIV